MREINKIILHCTATPEGRETTVKEVTQWHKDRGFSTIGYHYLIMLNGEICKGRDIERAGAHCSGHNTNSIGVSYVGGCDKRMKAKDTRTPEQKEAIKKIVAELKEKFPDATIHGHNAFSDKACPSFDVQAEFN